MRHELHAVTNAQDRDAGVEDCGVTNGRSLVRNALGPPDRMTPAGRLAWIASTGVSGAQISEKIDSSRSRRAINWVYWEPKSRTMMVSWATGGRELSLL